MPLPLTVSCFSKIQIGFTFLVPAHLRCPGQRAVKRMCVCVCVCGLCPGPPVVLCSAAEDIQSADGPHQTEGVRQQRRRQDGSDRVSQVWISRWPAAIYVQISVFVHSGCRYAGLSLQIYQPRYACAPFCQFNGHGHNNCGGPDPLQNFYVAFFTSKQVYFSMNCACMSPSVSDDLLSENHVSNHVEPHPSYTRGISVEQTTLNGWYRFLLCSHQL